MLYPSNLYIARLSRFEGLKRKRNSQYVWMDGPGKGIFRRFEAFEADTFEGLRAMESLYAEHMSSLLSIGDSAFGTMPFLKTLSLR